MSLAAVEKVSIDQNFALMGTIGTYTPSGGSATSVTGVWDTPRIEDVGPGKQLRRAVWFRASEVAMPQRGDVWDAPEPHGGSSKSWRVDERIAIEPGQTQVLVTEVLE